MVENRADDGERSKETRSGGLRPLVSWPLALLVLTLAMLLVANTVSAWGRGDPGDDLEEAKAHAEFFVERMLRRIDATDAQSEAIQQVVAATIDELAVLHGERGALREEARALLTAETIDREAIEAMRATHLERADQMSRIVSASLADVLEILTPEQRVQIEERIAERRHRRHRRWH